jgi:hypothetical protein
MVDGLFVLFQTDESCLTSELYSFYSTEAINVKEGEATVNRDSNSNGIH